MMDRTITMSIKEFDRVEIVRKCISKTLSQVSAAKYLNITDSEPNNKISNEVRIKAMKLIHERYPN